MNLKFAEAQSFWLLESMFGDACCSKTPLTIKQSGFDDIYLRAKYATNSFKLPIYYSVKVARWSNERTWELEMIHLKLKLKNNSPEVQRFEISHGFNLFYVNRSWKFREFIIGAGAGIVIAHPENTVRDKSLREDKGILNTGYYIAGPTLQFRTGKSFSLLKNLILTIEGKLTGAYASVPVADGYARMTNIAIHGLFGLGYKF